MLVSLVYPEFAAHSAFLTTTAQRDSLLAFMKQGPDRAHDTAFNDTAVFHPNFLNFNLFGSQKENPYPGAEYFNKSDMAYGFLADCGYLRDTITHVEFFLTVYIYVNKDGILNDTTYEYNTIGIPFMKRLGELCYKGILDQRFPSQTK